MSNVVAAIREATCCRSTFRSCNSVLGHVPLSVEHCEAAAAEVDVTRRWLDEQGRRELSFSFDALAERHGVPEVACAAQQGLIRFMRPIRASSTNMMRRRRPRIAAARRAFLTASGKSFFKIILGREVA